MYLSQFIPYSISLKNGTQQIENKHDITESFDGKTKNFKDAEFKTEITEKISSILSKNIDIILCDEFEICDFTFM